MRLVDITTKSNNGFVRLSGLVESVYWGKRLEVYFEYPERFKSFICKNADSFMPALLLPCMAKGEDLEICPPISSKLFYSLMTLQDIYTKWFPNVFKRIDVITKQKYKSTHDATSNVGAFFSLGVDSFYTLLKNMHNPNSGRGSITHLIFMNGLETPLVEECVVEKTKNLVIEVAKKTNKEYIYGKTNIRNIFPLDWDYHYHGAGLASVALSLSSGFNCVVIPSSRPYDDLTFAGSHPLLDPLWSIETTNIIHDGSEVDRAEKVFKFVGKDPLSLEYLRVCIANRGRSWNCGKCPKCIRTMISLQALGYLAKASTFPSHLPADFVKQVRVDDYHVSYAEANLSLAKRTSNDFKLIKTLERVIRVGKRKKASKMFLKTMPSLYNCAKKINKALNIKQ